MLCVKQKLRNTELLATVCLEDGWLVELRYRLTGKAAGQIYKMFKKGDSTYTSMMLGQVRGVCGILFAL